MSTSKILLDLYKNYTGTQPDTIKELTGSGSNRRYFRLSGPSTLVGVIGESVEENKAFIKLANRFAERGIPVPRVVAVTDGRDAYLQEDLGETLLFDLIENGRTTGKYSNEEIKLLELTIRRLPDIQFKGAEGLDFNICYPMAEFCRRTVMWDLNYFKYCFLKTSEISFNESRLEDDFERLASTLLDGVYDTFMYRDFQSRNVMIKDGQPFFIDFQGGRKGPVHYDVASFLWQAKANIPADVRSGLIDSYLDSAKRHANIDTELFKSRLRHFVLFRLLQVLGAYGFRGRFERKLHFLESIPAALEKVDELITTPFDEYPTLMGLLRELVSIERKKHRDEPKLTVTVTSFSYKRGIPEDASGNGGGFVFDCRALHNPGRYDEFKKLTGRDHPVIDFLEKRGEVQPFLQDCQDLVDMSVKTYLRRGFTSLMVNFGCTGGQHRSVYCADHLARHLAESFDVDVHLVHREQSIDETIRSSRTVNSQTIAQ